MSCAFIIRAVAWSCRRKFTGDYSNVKICGMQVIMYGGTQCSVFTRAGVHKFEGEMDEAILEMFPDFWSQ